MTGNSSVDGATFQSALEGIEPVQSALGSGETLSLGFDSSGRIDTELVSTQRSVRTNRRSL